MEVEKHILMSCLASYQHLMTMNTWCRANGGTISDKNLRGDIVCQSIDDSAQTERNAHAIFCDADSSARGCRDWVPDSEAERRDANVGIEPKRGVRDEATRADKLALKPVHPVVDYRVSRREILDENPVRRDEVVSGHVELQELARRDDGLHALEAVLWKADRDVGVSEEERQAVDRLDRVGEDVRLEAFERKRQESVVRRSRDHAELKVVADASAVAD